MKKSKIIEAKKEAQRFIDKVNKLLNKSTKKDYYNSSYCGYTKESGAVRRASMDLTRLLAEMRSSK